MNKISVSSDIMIKGRPASAGSKILSGFTAPFSAAAVEMLLGAGYEVQSVESAREFGIPNWIFDGAVGDSPAKHYLCNDYGGWSKYAAAKSGGLFLHPTYGRVSRFGLIQAASSMDQIGIFGTELSDVFGALEVISGRDERDITTFAEKYAVEKDAKPGRTLNPRVLSLSELKYLDTAGAAFFILSTSELSNNLSRYDGVKFGYRTKSYKNLEELYLNSRGEGFGMDAKLAATFGTAFLTGDYYADYYEKAMRLRRSFQAETIKLLDKYGVIGIPLDTDSEPDFKATGILSLPALTGLPALALRHKNSGLLLVAKACAENDLLTAAKTFIGGTK